MAYKPFTYGQFDMFTCNDGQWEPPAYSKRTGVPTTVYYDTDGGFAGRCTDCVRMWIIGPCPW